MKEVLKFIAYCLVLTCVSACSEKLDSGSSDFPTPSNVVVLQPNLDSLSPRVSEQGEGLINAISQLESTGSRGSELSNLYGKLGQFYLSQEYFPPAESAFGRAIELQPEAFQWWYLSGYVSKMEGKETDSIGKLNRALMLNESYLPLLILLGDTYLESGRGEEAKSIYERALALDSSYWPALTGLGQLYLSEDQVEESLPYLESAIKSQPKSRETIGLLKTAYRKLELTSEVEKLDRIENPRPVEIEDSLMSQVKLWKDPARMSLLKGDKLYLSKNYVAAEAEYRLTILSDSLSDSGWNNLALSLINQGKLDEAVETIAHGIEYIPKSRLLRMSSAKLNYRQGNLIETEELLRSLLKDFSGDYESRLLLGQILMNDSRFEQSLEQFEILSGNESFDQKGHRYLIKSLARAGRWDEALEELESIDGNAMELDTQRMLARYLMLSPNSSDEQKQRGFSTAKALFANSNTPQNMLIKAMELSITGKPLEASELLAQLIRAFETQSPDADTSAIVAMREWYSLGNTPSSPWQGYPYNF